MDNFVFRRPCIALFHYPIFNSRSRREKPRPKTAIGEVSPHPRHGLETAPAFTAPVIASASLCERAKQSRGGSLDCFGLRPRNDTPSSLPRHCERVALRARETIQRGGSLDCFGLRPRNDTPASPLLRHCERSLRHCERSEAIQRGDPWIASSLGAQGAPNSSQ
jgi:hypothetical protein